MRVFIGRADFSGAEFVKETQFRKAHFTGKADFRLTQFTGNTDFMGAHFTGKAEFGEAQFMNEVGFRLTQFTERANFIKARFTPKAYSDGFITGCTQVGNTQVIYQALVDSSILNAKIPPTQAQTQTVTQPCKQYNR